MSISGRYVRIATKFWSDEKVVELDTETKLLYLYFLSCPHSNMAGYYRLPKPYIIADLKLSDKQLGKGFAKLLERGLVKYCDNSSIILIPNYFKYNSIQNINQAKGAAKRTSELPKNSLIEDYLKAVKLYANNYLKELCKGLPEGFDKGLRKELLERFGNTETDTEPETDTDTDTESDTDTDTEKLDVPYKKIKEMYNEICQSFTPIRKMTDRRKKHIRARWREEKDIEVFKRVFENAEKSQFMQGDNDRSWTADFDWIIKNDTNFNKILEGKYNHDSNPDSKYNKRGMRVVN